ncbi:hypothetical protein B0T21DRAFT_372174 [Apiosordaria backusii]|uniref:GDP/GTP exchange factor Sec2 N-terminal domain-containing protein n=1 Tax=Apiosordaria backusii TaxID=314023 RepID=A0AA40AX89_9PEZI|nr:hypothetical protein B0T21DRAFT_372174 [Apiosordaria backusii]
MAVTNKLWQSFVTVAGWSSHQPVQPVGRPKVAHNRSLSSILRAASPKPSPGHARSISIAESSMTADIARSLPSTPQPKRLFSPQEHDDENDLSTIPDPRSRAMSPADPETMATSHHPDLDQEVATLSTKLINAINHQTTLDDNLSATRLELEKAREMVRQLEDQVAEQREMLAGDVWVRRKTVEAEKSHLLARVAEEKRARADMEQQKKKIEQELENLTAALFEEANKMVISAKEEARKEQEVLQRKNDQLKAQLADTEAILRSQQEQLVELKNVMEQMTAANEEQSPPTCPSSPSFSKFEDSEGPSITMNHPHHSHSQSLPATLSPSYPTSFTQLLHPVLRTDLAAFRDFKDLVHTSKRLSSQRTPSNASSSGLVSLGLGLGSVASHVSAGNLSSTSLATNVTASSPATSPQTPNTPASSVSATSSTAAPVLPQLKETKFYKRVLTEDIEPTLRLDNAPGLSWLARRSVLTAMTEGTLVVEPAPSTTTGRFGRIMRPELIPCSLCGEQRTEEQYLRTHRFRTSESDSAQNAYPLCKYCLGRVRSTCDFLGFLRIVKDGHWRADDEDAERAAWEESVRLRDQMFWSRIGGGVVPGGHPHRVASSVAPSIRGERSPRPSHEISERFADVPEVPEPVDLSKELPKTPEQHPADETVPAPQQPPALDNVEEDNDETPPAVMEDEKTPPAVTETQKPPPATDEAVQSLKPQASVQQVEVKPLSLTIP